MMWALPTPGSQARQAGLDLRDHPLVDHALGDQVAALVGRQTRDQALGFVPVAEDAGRVGQEHELLGLQRHGDGRGGGVGVHVEPAAVVVLGQRGEDGHDAGQAEVLDRLGVDLVTSPTRPRSIGSPLPSGSVSRRRRGTGWVLWCRPDGPAAELADVPDDVRVDLLGAAPGRRWRAWRRRCNAGPGPIGPPARRVHRAVIALPPPWTTTGRMPTVCMKTTSCSRARSASGSSMTEPPSLMTANLPWNVRK